MKKAIIEMKHGNIVIELFLLVLGWVDDVNQLNDESQENQNCEYDNHVSKANGKRAWSIHELNPPFYF